MSKEHQDFTVRQEEDNPRPKLLLVLTALFLLGTLVGVIYTVFLMGVRERGLEGQMLPAQFGDPREIRGTEQYLFDDEPGFPEEVGESSARRILKSYGWVERERGVIRIPIERAKELLLQREAE